MFSFPRVHTVLSRVLYVAMYGAGSSGNVDWNRVL